MTLPPAMYSFARLGKVAACELPNLGDSAGSDGCSCKSVFARTARHELGCPCAARSHALMTGQCSDSRGFVRWFTGLETVMDSSRDVLFMYRLRLHVFSRPCPLFVFFALFWVGLSFCWFPIQLSSRSIFISTLLCCNHTYVSSDHNADGNLFSKFSFHRLKDLFNKTIWKGFCSDTPVEVMR